MAETNPLDLLKDELDNDDIQIKVNAIHRLPVIMALFSQDKIISELIPFILKILPIEEDEVLLAISEEVPHFITYLDERNVMNILPLFRFLLGSEETVVRDSAVEGFRKFIDNITDDQVQKSIIPMLMEISNLDAFQWKVSSICLIRTLYPKSGKDKEKLRILYFKLCDDETPIIKRTAAKEFGPLCLVIEKEYVSKDMVLYYKKFMNESDSVRVTILPSLVQLAKLFQNSEHQRINLQFIVAASEDKSWRVRNELSLLFPQFIDFFGNQINELVPTLSNLIKDSEIQVKISALKGLNKIISKISADKILSCVVSAIKGLNNESSKEVKANIGECFGPISKIIGYNQFNTHLGAMMDFLMKDENADVRLGVAKSMNQIFLSSEGSLLTSTNSLLGTMQKDNQYRIRECVYQTLSKLGAYFGLEVFKSSIESLYFNFLNDTVASVREVGINSLMPLMEKFGNPWVATYLIPKLTSFLTSPKTSYLNRMCVLNALGTCSIKLEPKQNTDLLFPVIQRGLKDKIANVRFVTIKIAQQVYKSFDSSGKDKIVNGVKLLLGDDDDDVKYYCNKFFENIK